MKKLLLLTQIIAVAMLYSSATYADDDGYGWGGHGHGHGPHGWGGHHGHHREHYYPQPQINYYPQPQINYYQPPQVNYYPQPQVNYYPQPQEYYPPQPRYQNYDRRSHQGLAGGVVGSVFGYEIGNGDPIAAGLGAAAGSFLGNGFR